LERGYSELLANTGFRCTVAPTLSGTQCRMPTTCVDKVDRDAQHVFFVAETKGSMSTMDLRRIEAAKLDCARRFFAKITSEQLRHDVVDGYGKLMELVK